MNPDYCVSLHNVSKSFGDKQVLIDIELAVPYGHIYGLLGPSGSGKTTMVKIIAGITAATLGQVSVLGQKMPKLELMNRIGYMAQGDALYDDLSAEENLNFFGALYGLKRHELKEKIPQVLELVNLEQDIKRKVGVFSGGMKRRLSLAIALIHSPPLLLLDEPTVGIDPVLRKSIWDEFKRLTSQGVTILLTTHVMDEAEKCDYLAMLRDGNLIATGKPVDLQSSIGVTSIEEAFLFYGGNHES